jgi:hypothetical protein
MFSEEDGERLTLAVAAVISFKSSLETLSSLADSSFIVLVASCPDEEDILDRRI